MCVCFKISHVHIALKIVLKIFEFSYALKLSISLYLYNKSSLQYLKIYDANVKHNVEYFQFFLNYKYLQFFLFTYLK